MDVFISTLVNAKGMDKRWEDKKVVQLNCEYLMIEAAANAQAKVCSLLLPWCDFQAFTLEAASISNFLLGPFYFMNFTDDTQVQRTAARGLEESRLLRQHGSCISDTTESNRITSC
jgi:hypothetical protein